jgi:hypothetical protein
MVPERFNALSLTRVQLFPIAEKVGKKAMATPVQLKLLSCPVGTT